MKDHSLGTDPSGYSIRPPKVTSVNKSGLELKIDTISFKQRRKKIGLRGFRPGLAQTCLCSH